MSLQNQLHIERDNIILASIAKFGCDVMPQDYRFLNQYFLKNLYFEIVNNKTANLPTSHLESAVKQQASLQISEDCNFDAIKSFRDRYGDKDTKALLGHPRYWKVFLYILRKKKHEYDPNHI